MREIRLAADVTEVHVEQAVEMRDGLFGGTPLPWDEVIDRLEEAAEDWGSSLDSPAIRELKRRVRAVQKDSA